MLPRPCGIATFHHDVNFSLKQFNIEIFDVALQRGRRKYAYPTSVVSTIRQEVKSDYTKAAVLINQRRPDVVLLQHEFGIYGGLHGAYVLHLLRKLSVPVVVVMHRYEIDQDTEIERQRAQVAQDIARYADRVIIISKTAQKKLSQDLKTRGITTPVIHIPHGTPIVADYWLADPKQKILGKNVPVLTTFGLISERKGIQDIVEIMPQIVNRFPTAVYRVLGQPHPTDFKAQAFLNSLKQRIKQLKLEKNVSFITRFLSVQEIMKNLQATDIYLTFYSDPSQTSSGTLSFALAAGCCIISTPYVHAKELLADGRGTLVPFHDRKALTEKILTLLQDNQTRSEYRRRALIFGRKTAWPLVGRRYFEELKIAAHDRRKFVEYTLIKH